MHTIIEFLRNTDITANTVEVFASIALALWAAFTGSRWHKQIQESRLGGVYDAILVGARVTYVNVYKRLKEQLKASGGVLDKAAIDKLQEYAYREALRAAKEGGVKQALIDLTDEEYDLLLERAVNQLKREGGKLPALPAAA